MTIQLHIEGARCASCVSKIEAALTPIDGVKSVQVNLADQSVEITGEATPDALIQALDTIGYPARPLAENEDSLSVPGMRCASCVGKVENALSALPGVTRVQVNLADKTVLISGRYNLPQALSALDSIGYPGDLQDAPLSEDDSTHVSGFRTQMMQSALALTLGLVMMVWGWIDGMTVESWTDQWLWGAAGGLTLVMLIYAGGHYFRGAWQALKHGSATMDTLIALGTGTAWLFSMAVVLIPEAFPAASRHLYFEASAMIIGLINLGQALEHRAKSKTNTALRQLMALRPKTARVIRDGQERDMPIRLVQVGDQLRLRPGEQVPVDGVVLEGRSLVDESMLTGEPMPVEKVSGGELSAGTLNKQGSLIMSAQRVGADTALAQIIELVRHAQSSKLPIANLANRISAVFVPAVVLIALISATIWFLWGPDPRLTHALVVLTTVLIIACPCALGLATPMSVINGVGKAAQLGLLVREGSALQTATDLTALVVDKTGTLTEGRPSVTDQLPAPGVEPHRLLIQAAALEQGSEHPLAEAILHAAHGETLPPLNEFEAHTGLGVEGQVEGRHLILGNHAMMTQWHVDTDSLDAEVARLANEGKTPVYLAADGQLQGVLAIADPIRDDARSAIDRLHTQGIKVVMLTGDHPDTAAAVARQLGIDQFEAQMRPEDKVRVLKSLQQSGDKVAMAGDGINDAPALAQADVGFAIGSGTDIAKASADIILIRSSLHGVADAIALSRATLRNIKQNLFGAFIYNSLGIPIAAGVLYPLTGTLLNPVVAGAAMALSSLTVVTNANRLRWFQPRH
ncbi:heavy metal translocating P-type ATPase [Ferrimonas balearica]|uniref:heavy metal translocating P-type ATPase n=1 Tax=Ferrimonas balearica TaxID=44012 RepID=UPI001C990EF3|nr:heavy metal translocating P-type ATPase [Ferrimonas balearica]MBY5923566.1 heavy metal translocating P-type ATPase [Ferrimonas balearica]MBY5997885.1 heavy metal translocating P-type ATPase [Ferrimonas balearica]